jgi:hypothetical protein
LKLQCARIAIAVLANSTLLRTRCRIHHRRWPWSGDWHQCRQNGLASLQTMSASQFNDPKRNGGRTIRELASHLNHDLILHWTWYAGGNREPVPYSLQEATVAFEVGRFRRPVPNSVNIWTRLDRESRYVRNSRTKLGVLRPCSNNLMKFHDLVLQTSPS